MNRYSGLLWGGLFTGILDLTAAITISILRGRTALQLLQLVASGLLGAKAYAGGMRAALLGVAMHFLIAFGASAVYFFASLRLRFLHKLPVLWGMLYGVAVYFFMNLVVLPLSAYPHPISFSLMPLVRGLLVHMFCVGLPIALAISYSERKRLSKSH